MMSPDEFVTALESGSLAARSHAPPGAGETLFNRILELHGVDVEAASKLAQSSGHYRWDDADRAHVLRAKALGHYGLGHWLTAAKLFQLAARHQSGEMAGSFAIPAIDALARRGRTQDALKLGRSLVQKLGPSSVMAARARVNIGNLYEQEDEAKFACREYLAAIRALEKSEFRLDLAKAHAGASTAFLVRGEFAEAQRHAQAAVDIFKDHGQLAHAAVAETNLAQIACAQGRADRAVITLEDCRKNLPEWRIPWLEEILGDAYLALNMWSDAERAYQRALVHEDMRSTSIGYANCLLGVGCALHGMSMAREALAWLQRAKRRHHALGNRAMSSAGTLLECEILVRQGQFRRARVRALAAIEGLESTDFRSLQQRLSLVVADCNWRLKINEPPVEEAASKLKKSPLPSLRWRAWQHACKLSTGAEKRKNQLRLVDEIMQSRLAIQSQTARLGFLADKATALQEVLLDLLVSENTKDHATARDILLQTRSVTLIDEIESAVGSEFSRVIADLQEVRARVADAGDFDDDLRFRRLTSRTPHWESHRQSLSLATAKIQSISRSARAESVGCDMYVRACDELFFIRECGDVVHLSASTTKLQQLMAAVRFELSDPMHAPKSALASLRELGHHVKSEFLSDRLSPDDQLWDIPWAGIAPENEITLYLSPAWIEPHSLQLAKAPNVVVWSGDSAGLPQIQAEVKLLERKFGKATICRTRAEAVASLQGQPIDILHVAAHGEHVSNNPMMSSIFFPDGRLFAAEVAASRTKLKYAILLSCDSGKLSSLGGSEPSGWVRAFLACGAHAAVAMGWQLEDTAAITFAEALYREWMMGHSLSGALQRARAELRSAYPHPFFWASPMLFGGYRSSNFNGELIHL